MAHWNKKRSAVERRVSHGWAVPLKHGHRGKLLISRYPTSVYSAEARHRLAEP